MKIKYFQDADTLYIEFKSTPVSESRDLDEKPCLTGRGRECVRYPVENLLELLAGDDDGRNSGGL